MSTIYERGCKCPEIPCPYHPTPSRPFNNKPTDLQAALREACKEAAGGCIDSLDDTAYENEYQIRKFTDIIERHLTPVFDALRDSVIEECAEIARPHPYPIPSKRRSR